MKNSLKSLLVAIVILPVALIFVGCGGDDDGRAAVTSLYNAAIGTLNYAGDMTIAINKVDKRGSGITTDASVKYLVNKTDNKFYKTSNDVTRELILKDSEKYYLYSGDPDSGMGIKREVSQGHANYMFENSIAEMFEFLSFGLNDYKSFGAFIKAMANFGEYSIMAQKAYTSSVKVEGDTITYVSTISGKFEGETVNIKKTYVVQGNKFIKIISDNIESTETVLFSYAIAADAYPTLISGTYADNTENETLSVLLERKDVWSKEYSFDESLSATEIIAAANAMLFGVLGGEGVNQSLGNMVTIEGLYYDAALTQAITTFKMPSYAVEIYAKYQLKEGYSIIVSTDYINSIHVLTSSHGQIIFTNTNYSLPLPATISKYENTYDVHHYINGVKTTATSYTVPAGVTKHDIVLLGVMPK